MITWRLLLDSDDDGLFDDALIFSGVIRHMEIRAGFANEFERVASVPSVSVLVNNISKLYYPEQAGAYDLRVGRWARIEAVLSASTYTIFTGVLKEVQYVDNNNLLIHLSSRLEWFEQRLKLALQVEKRTDEILAAFHLLSEMALPDILNEASSGLPWCIIDTHSIGSCAVRGSDTIPEIELDEGVITLPYYGGLVDDNRTAFQVIQEIVDNELGYFYEDRSGVLTFRNAHYLLENYSELADFDDSLAKFKVRWAADVINRVFGRYVTRSIFTGVVWTAASNLRLYDMVDTQRIIFKADDGRVMGLLPDTAITFNFSYLNINLAPVTDIAAVVEERLDNGLVVSFHKTIATRRYLAAGSTITATVLLQGDIVEIELVAEGLTYGRKDYNLRSLSYMDQDDGIDRLNSYLLGRNEQRGYVDSIRLYESTEMLSLELLSLVRVASDLMGHDRLYRVIGWHYVVDEQYRPYADVSLMPAYDEKYLIVNVSGRNLIGTHWVAL